MSRRSFIVILALLVLLMGLTALRIGQPELFGVDAVSADYMIFHQVGELSQLGRAAEAYDAVAFRAYQEERTGSSVFMTWTYPPQFNLALHPMAVLSPSLGYFSFTLASFGLFIFAMFRLNGSVAQPVILLCLPAMVINLLTGQNGFLTAALMGLSAHFALTARPFISGIMLGLLTYKPHLGLGLGLAALLRGGVRLWGTATAVLLLLIAFSTWAYGPHIWQALLGSIETSRALLESASYKLERMNTIFALTASLGLKASAAMSLQFAFALAGLFFLAFCAVKGWSLRSLMALGILTGTLTSPYAYDYDLCMLAPALALSWTAIITKLTHAERLTLNASVLFAGGYGLATVILANPLREMGIAPLSLGGLGVLIAIALMIRALWRAEVS